MNATVACATSFDERFDPQNVLNGADNFWVTTGLYPQEIMLEFKQPKSITQIDFAINGGK